MDGSLPGSSVDGILQARILEWVVIPFSRGSSRPRDQTQVSCITGSFFTTESPRKPIVDYVGSLKWVKQHSVDKGKLLWFHRPNFPLKPKEIVSMGYFIYPKAFLYNYFHLAKIEEAADMAQC